MANFIYSGNCCCSIGERENETLSVGTEAILVKQDTNEQFEFGYGCSYPPEGTLLVVKYKWVLRKNYETIAKFDTEAEAQAELKRIVDELAKSNLVVQVK